MGYGVLYCYLLNYISIFYVTYGYVYSLCISYLIYSMSDYDIRKGFKHKLYLMLYKSFSFKSYVICLDMN